MRTLVIPDIHNHTDTVDAILKAEAGKYDKAIMLGDYFDDFHDNPLVVRQTALWLKKIAEDKKIVLLLGNHDLSYAYPSRQFEGYGWSFVKSFEVDQVLDKAFWSEERFCFHYWEQDWLLSHAGFHLEYVRGKEANLRAFLHGSEEAAWKSLRVGRHHWFWSAGWARGGSAIVGGPVWCDAHAEFVPIEGVKQLFGHTHSKVPQQCGNEWNYCIDTAGKFYAVLQDGKLEVKESPLKEEWGREMRSQERQKEMEQHLKRFDDRNSGEKS